MMDAKTQDLLSTLPDEVAAIRNGRLGVNAAVAPEAMAYGHGYSDGFNARALRVAELERFLCSVLEGINTGAVTLSLGLEVRARNLVLGCIEDKSNG